MLNETEWAALASRVLAAIDERVDPRLFYHDGRHARDVIAAAELLATMEGVGFDDWWLLRLAALFHDAGFILKPRATEEDSILAAHEMLDASILNDAQWKQFDALILATILPQRPDGILQEILCDADMDYLGRDDFFDRAHAFWRERNALDGKINLGERMRETANFITTHRYFTRSAKSLRDAGARRNLALLHEMCARNVTGQFFPG